MNIRSRSAIESRDKEQEETTMKTTKNRFDGNPTFENRRKILPNTVRLNSADLPGWARWILLEFLKLHVLTFSYPPLRTLTFSDHISYGAGVRGGCLSTNQTHPRFLPILFYFALKPFCTARNTIAYHTRYARIPYQIICS